MARFMLPPRNAPAEVHKAARDQFVQLMKTTLRKQSNEARDKIADSLAKNNISRDLVRNWEGSPFTRQARWTLYTTSLRIAKDGSMPSVRVRRGRGIWIRMSKLG